MRVDLHTTTLALQWWIFIATCVSFSAYSNVVCLRRIYNKKNNVILITDRALRAGLVQANETLFGRLYRAAMNYDYYRNTWFVPTFNASPLMTSSSPLYDEMSALCGTNAACQYDFTVTGNPSLAADTLRAVQADSQTRRMAATGALAGL